MKVYIIGADKETDLAHIRKIGNIPEATEIILVDSAESIPLEDRFKSSVIVHEIHKIIALPKINIMSHEREYHSKKKKDNRFKYHK